MNKKLDLETVGNNLDDYLESKDINFDLVTTLNDELITEEVEKKPESSYFEEKKQRALKYYNSVKSWAGEEDAKKRTSCLHGIGINQLNEWLGENNNDCK